MNRPAERRRHSLLSRHSMKISVLFACILSLVAGAAVAQEFKAGSLEIDQPWSRATPKGAKVAAGYLTIKNTGTDPDRLVSVTSPVARKSEIHEMSMGEGTVSRSNKGTNRRQSLCQLFVITIRQGAPHVPCSIIPARPSSPHQLACSGLLCVSVRARSCG